MYFIGTSNIGTQTVATNGLINVGVPYRKYCTKLNGIPIFDTANGGIVLQRQGMYHLTLTAVGTGTEAGDVTIQIYENGVPVTAQFSTETITTADTEFRTFVIDYYILVDNTCLLGQNTTITKTITALNTGVEATFTKVVLNIEKVV